MKNKDSFFIAVGILVVFGLLMWQDNNHKKTERMQSCRQIAIEDWLKGQNKKYRWWKTEKDFRRFKDVIDDQACVLFLR